MRPFAPAAALLLAAAAAGSAAAQQVLSPADVAFLFGERNARNEIVREGAEDRIQTFYHYFNKDRDARVAPPAWVDKTLDAMLRHPVWQDPDQGILNEAQLWQSPASVLYEFLELVRRSLPPAAGGQSLPPADLLREYEDGRVRFQISLDRLTRARLQGSLGGRGRAVLASFGLIDRQMESAISALVAGDAPRWRGAVLAVGALSDGAFAALQAPPRGYAPAAPARRPSPWAMLLLPCGVGAAFLTAYLLGALNDERLQAGLDRYRAKAKEWAHEYERQFVAVRIHYLVGAPIALGVIVGALTLDPIGFLIFAAFGLLAGLRLPGWLLRNIRLRRGQQCEAQLMDAMILMSNGLKSGVDLVGCIEMVTKDLQPPISEEFGLCLKNYHLGTKLENALEGVEERVQSRLLSYMIKAVVIQRSVGGNLTKIFDRIVENIREESKLVEKTAAMTAQQRIQAIVVGVMPWIMLLIMFAFQPGPMKEFYFTPLGAATLVFCTIWISIGMRIVNALGDVSV
ncbi:MAG: type II secretion system F family protein [Elusimicrobia bacterium]|nr:type II secretion system F family protein [Elusimicrobiota bacterium]